MAQVLIRNLDDRDVEALKAASKAGGKSFEAFAREILSERARKERKLAALEESDRFREEDRRWREQSGLPPEAFPTAVEIIREIRSDGDPSWTE